MKCQVTDVTHRLKIKQLILNCSYKCTGSTRSLLHVERAHCISLYIHDIALNIRYDGLFHFLYNKRSGSVGRAFASHGGATGSSLGRDRHSGSSTAKRLATGLNVTYLRRCPSAAKVDVSILVKYSREERKRIVEQAK